MAVLQLPASIKVTHQTAGLPGYPAQDIFGTPGATVLSPVDGVISRLSGSPPSRGAYQGAGGPFGYSVYVTGADGRSYFLTHFGSVGVRAGQRVRAGQALGTVGDYPGATPDHIHEGVHGGTTTLGDRLKAAAGKGAVNTLGVSVPGLGSAAGATADAAGDVAGAAAGLGADAISAGLNKFFGGFFDQLKADSSSILLTIGLLGLGAVLAFAGFNQLAGGGPARTAKSIGKRAAVAAAV